MKGHGPKNSPLGCNLDPEFVPLRKSKDFKSSNHQRKNRNTYLDRKCRDNNKEKIQEAKKKAGFLIFEKLSF